MDRTIEQKTGIRKIFQKKYVPYWIGGVVVIVLAYLLINTDSNSVTVSKDNFTIATVKNDEFNDYIRQSGQVLPLTTVQISPLEGGIVEEIINEEGTTLKAGDVIIRLSNQQLEMDILHAEADLAEKENHLRNTMIEMEKQKLDLEQNRLIYTKQLSRARRDYEQKKKLYAENLCSKEEYLQAEEDYQLAQQQLQLNQNRAKQDSLYRGIQIQNLNENLASMRRNMEMIHRRKSNLEVKAPIDGELGLLDVVLGQSVGSGMKIGQINNLSSYKIEVSIDEYYIDRVTPGLDATFEKNNDTYSAQIRKVYPEVRNGKFRADLKFTGEQPDNIRTGQTYYLNIQLGSPTNSIIIPKGNFYQRTGGRWIYVVDANGNTATKRSIRIGRQNPKYYEVLEGLNPGEKVIVSGYENFGDNDRVVISE
ncbi:MAG: efflux RND transporter periplasmic adaptor subunit [Bacteroidales bacterium]|nr:efflux RND transporter periplasmic adaptor subunit [Bacteroidales bacterium]